MLDHTDYRVWLHFLPPNAEREKNKFENFAPFACSDSWNWTPAACEASKFAIHFYIASRRPS